MRISHNMMAINADRMLGITKSKKAEATQKLSSGYKINRAADDAAGLAISEKMRSMIRGLDQGVENAEDGVSWVQVGDGAMGEAQEILHRMTELSVKAMNGVNSQSDRMAMELEFEQLQCELDRISATTEFNEMNIFEQHEYPYYQCEGSVKWDPQQMHVVTAGENDLVFKYSRYVNDTPQTLSITVPPGQYSTQELVDEIDTALRELNNTKPMMYLEFTADGFCNANLEGGQMIDSVSGGLSYLLYDMYQGGSYGALIGTTSFPDENAPLKIVSGQNDKMSFLIESFDGTTQEKSITIPQGGYTKSQLIDLLNNQLTDTSVRATAYGTGIKLGSDEAIVTGFKGNMFKIDGDGNIYNSVFYDNIKYGTVSKKEAEFTGGYVLPTNSRDQEHRYYRIDSSNNTLTLQPNGAENPISLTIPDGSYTAEQMASKLNELFDANGIKINASRIYSGGYEGLKLTSEIEGVDSKINPDTSSSAYKALFVTREYNQYGSYVYPSNETKDDKDASYSGTKDLTSLSTTPLTITTGVNDSFKLTLTEGGNTTDYIIKLSAGTYNSAQDIQTEIDNRLNGTAALAGYKGKVTVSVTDNKIVLTGTAGQSIDKIRVTADSANGGYDAIFQGYKIVTTAQTATGTGSVTLNTPYDGNIDSSESNMTIKVDGVNHNVTLPTGAVSQDDIKVAVETAIPERTETTPNTFTAQSDSGRSWNYNFGHTASGTEKYTSWSDYQKGSSTQKEGVVGFETNTPAKLTIGPALKDSMTVTSATDEICITLNGITKTLTLDEGTYTPETLKNTLQSKINAEFGTGMGSAKVTVENGQLVLTSVLPSYCDGNDTSIQCSTGTSSFLKELATDRGEAVWKSSKNLASSIQIDGTNQDFSFTYKENGVSETIHLTLSQGTYTRTGIANEINKQLKNAGKNITASVNSNNLHLTSEAVGTNVSITYSTTTGGSSAEAMFGPLQTAEVAKIEISRSTQNPIEIVSGVSDTFSITVDGTKQTVTLDDGTYTPAEFVNMLNTKLASIGVVASESNGILSYETVDKGSSASLYMSYSGGGTSMEAIYGVTTKTYSGVEVSFDADGKMILNTTLPGSTISVPSSGGSAFQDPVVTHEPLSIVYSDGYHSAKSSYIDGVNLSGNVTIDQWNNNLNFTYEKDGSNLSVSVEIPQKEYTQDELAAQLQSLLDDKVGSNEIVVSVNSSGVRLETVNVGSKYGFSSFSGDFYDKVICSCTERSVDQTTKNVDGTQLVDAAYAVGRKDVRGITEIRNGISDELSLDLTYGNQTHTINIKLDAGEYTGSTLVRELQEKINEQLVQENLPEGLIEVNIGGVNSNVGGSNDNNSLNFKISKTVDAPAEGQYIIDGVRGSAAFEIFYQTDGSNEPAYIMGNKNVSGGVTLGAAQTNLSFAVDDVPYSVTFPEGTYSATELIEVMNRTFEDAGAPVVTEIVDGKLKLTHKKLGVHEISEVGGSARTVLFFEENGESRPLADRRVQLSNQVHDNITLNRHVFNTVSLGLNSCCITQQKYAAKTINRINKALEIMSSIRSDFGSTQNRLEHSIANNDNKIENLQSAESIIRDADMAEEMMRLTQYNIIQQAGESVLAQANQSHQGVLKLLQ